MGWLDSAHIRGILMTNWSTGKAVSIHAGAYSKGTPRTLYREATCNGRELPAHDQYPANGAPTDSSSSTNAAIRQLWYANNPRKTYGMLIFQSMVMKETHTPALKALLHLLEPWKTNTQLQLQRPLLSHSFTTINPIQTGTRKL